MKITELVQILEELANRANQCSDDAEMLSAAAVLYALSAALHLNNTLAMSIYLLPFVFDQIEMTKESPRIH